MTKSIDQSKADKIAKEELDKLLKEFDGDLNNLPEDEGGILIGGKKNEDKQQGTKADD